METFEEKSELETHKAKLQEHIENKKILSQSQLELFKATIAYGQNAMKVALLVNGGAVLAMLTFIGKISEFENWASKIKDLSLSLLMFSLALFFVLIATGVSYFAQKCYQEHSLDVEKTKKCNIKNYFTIFFISISYILFFCGVCKTYLTFQNF